MRVAFDIQADATQLTELEAGVLMTVAMFQPVTRAEISEMVGREFLRDLIAALREEGLIAAGPRSPKLGVTTESFLSEFGFESLRDRPDIEALKDAGRLSGGAPGGDGGAGDSEANAVNGHNPPGATLSTLMIAPSCRRKSHGKL